MQFAHFVQLSYWFSVFTPPFRPGAFIALVVMLGVCFLAGIALRVVPRKKQMPAPLVRIFARASRPLFFFSILGTLLVWFRQIGAAILSVRALLLLIFLITVAWLAVILRGSCGRYRSDLATLEKQRAYKSYLPKRK